MGQQQLLLVILVTIIVGVATVVAISVFGKGAENANIDATRQDGLTLGAMAQSWVIKPELLGGGNGEFTNVTVDDIGFGYDQKTSDLVFSNANASFIMTPGTTSLEIEATPKQLELAKDQSDASWDSYSFKFTITRSGIELTETPQRASTATTS